MSTKLGRFRELRETPYNLRGSAHHAYGERGARGNSKQSQYIKAMTDTAEITSVWPWRSESLEQLASSTSCSRQYLGHSHGPNEFDSTDRWLVALGFLLLQPGQFRSSHQYPVNE